MSETVTIPEAGRLYRYDDRELVFVTSAASSADHWAVAGYLVTRGYVLTETLEGWSGPNGIHYGVPREPFCTPAGVPAGSEGQRPLFSARFPASDYSAVTAVEAQGRKRHMSGAPFPVNVCKYCEKMLVPGGSGSDWPWDHAGGEPDYVTGTSPDSTMPWYAQDRAASERRPYAGWIEEARPAAQGWVLLTASPDITSSTASRKVSVFVTRDGVRAATPDIRDEREARAALEWAVATLEAAGTDTAAASRAIRDGIRDHAWA